ncbi:MAG: iron-containing alcohol dehydrogenase [Eubacteriales bacterium]|nr:iron-containing alcohol dehydrogenase [Eubacteriales bacterium]
MFDFNFYTPTRVVFGRGAERKTGKLLRQAGARKVLVCYGGGSVIRSGLMDWIRSALKGEDIDYVELSGIVPNPRLSKVYEGIALGEEEGIDFLLAVGGGSVIDTAKAIGYGLANEGDVWDFYERTRKPAACLPLGVVLTIAASGSEMSNSSVITKDEGMYKRSCNTDLARPVFAVMDPALTVTLPAYQTASGCVDILMHTMERYFTNGGNMEITDALAEGLMRTVMRNALILRDHPDSYEARAEVMWAGSLSHNGLTGCGSDGGDFACHGLEHELGGMFDVTHGAGLAAIWGSWARYVYRDCRPRFYRFARRVMDIVGEGSEDAICMEGIEAMEAFFRSIHMPTDLQELGIEPTDEQLCRMAHLAAEAAGGSKGSAKVLHECDMLQIYRLAAEG